MKDEEYRVLANELKKPEYAGKTYDEIAKLLNAPTIARLSDRRITWRTVMKVLGIARTGEIYSAMEQMSAGNKGIALVMRMMESYHEGGGVSLNNAEADRFFNELVANRVITQQERKALENEISDRVSRAHELGLPDVSPGHVKSALERNWV